MQEHTSATHPTHDFMAEVAEKALTMEEVRKGFPALWVHLQECSECFEAFQELLRLAHEAGHREGHAEETETRQAVVMTAIAAVVAIALLAGGALLWQRETAEAAVNRVYQAVSPAVANIRVPSAGVTGSGVIFDRDGYVLTNFHVIRDAQSNDDIVVQLAGLNEVSVQVVGYDIATDLAVLKLNEPPDRLAVAEFGDSNAVTVGELAIVIGNPFGLSRSLTVGHISAVQRRFLSNDMYAPDVKGVLQTDAAINPGNSGGPLLNANGQVIGINTRIESPSGGSVGLGFATPSNTALRVAREIIEHGYVRRPFLGVGGQAVNDALARDLGLSVNQGLLVQETHDGSPAAKLGLRTSVETGGATSSGTKKEVDVIVSVNGQPVRSQSDLNQLIAEQEIGDTVKLEVLRGSERITLETALSERPPDPMGLQFIQGVGTQQSDLVAPIR